MRFVDECQLELIAGNGGSGIIAWHREACNAYGGPSGGDGGKGGSVVICANENTPDFLHLSHLKTIRAENGKDGRANCQNGKNGQNQIIFVPVGTSIYNDNNQLICDLTDNKQNFVICRGGRAGYGNARFKSAQNRIPHIYERGDRGEKKIVHLRLRFLANVGIVGLPNAGKSTLINAISNVKSRVGDYPFTTLTPVLGTVSLNEKKLLFVDIPGLIESASCGKGLGHSFLKHIERCQILLHLISMDPNDNIDVIKSYEIIKNELASYSQNLLLKKNIVVANKSDAFGANTNYKKLVNHLKNKICFISAKNNDLNSLISQIFEQYQQMEDHEQVNGPKKYHKYLAEKNNTTWLDNFKICRIEEKKATWKIFHPQIEYWLQRIPLTTPDNIQHFKNKLRKMKINKILQKYCADSSDKILIGSFEFSLGDFF